jgi:D-glycero-D-manno-heptose 1,7-bisphosphate phosphatase
MNKAVFLDKDGTLIHDVPYNTDTSLIKFYDDAFKALQALSLQGYLLIIVSNQSGIARGYFTVEDFFKVEQHMMQQLAQQGIPLQGFYFCPHHPDGSNSAFSIDCYCRKPNPGMLLHAAEEHDIDLSASWMIGDILNDVEAGNKAGCNTILIDNGNETEWIMNPQRQPGFTAASLLEAAEHILACTTAEP